MKNLAFKTHEYEGFQLSAYYNATQNADIEITRNGESFRKFLYPAYRIWNLHAHFQDMVDELLAQESKTDAVRREEAVGRHEQP